MRKIRRSKIKRKELNIQRNKYNPNKLRYQKPNKYKNVVEEITIDAGTKFALFDDPEGVIELIQKIDRYKKVSRYLKKIFIDLSHIVLIDIAAINILLAKINEISKVKRLYISGNMPKEKGCHELFEKSGFLDYMVDLSGKKFAQKSLNFLLNIGADKTLNEKIGRSIEKSMKFITGTEQKYPPVYSIVQEMCSNSIEWANSKNSRNKNWLLGVQLDTTNHEPVVNYALTDIGYGILNTVHRKLGTKIIENIGNISDIEILNRIFEKHYGSKSKEPNRNKGMPLIKDRLNNEYICNLRVLTNHVLLNFCNEESSKVLNRNFPGTFYFWSINKKCLEKWTHK